MIFRFIRRLLADRRGNVAPMFALAVIPMLGLIGAAVDYSRANSIKTSLQAAIDSTALAMSSQASTLTTAQLQTAATAYFNALFTRTDALNPSITITYSTTGGSHVDVTGSAQMTTNFVGILGVPTMSIGTKSTAAWGNTRLRVALVLDNTGSMSQSGKITALKTATNNLLDQLKGAVTTNGDVYVSIIPFSVDVNVGSSNYNANWIDWTDWDSNNQTCSWWGGGCSTNNHNTWNGCVADRGTSSGPVAANYDQNVTAPIIGTAASLYPADQSPYCPQAIMGLSYDWTTMKNVVNNMSPNGSTNQPIGLVWGWLSLVGGGPLTAPAMDPNYTYQPGHHPVVGRLEHPGPLVWRRLQCIDPGR